MLRALAACRARNAPATGPVFAESRWWTTRRGRASPLTSASLDEASDQFRHGVQRLATARDIGDATSLNRVDHSAGPILSHTAACFQATDAERADTDGRGVSDPLDRAQYRVARF